MNIEVFTKGDIIFYKDLQGILTVYVVVNKQINKDNGKIEYRINEVSGRGKTKKAFNTTIRNKKGEIRLFRSWLQIGDNVSIKNEMGSVVDLGTVDMVYADVDRNRGTSKICISVVNERRQEEIYNLEQASKYLELVSPEVVYGDDDDIPF